MRWWLLAAMAACCKSWGAFLLLARRPQDDSSATAVPIRYVSHHFRGGAKCVMTGEQRSAEVGPGAGRQAAAGAGAGAGRRGLARAPRRARRCACWFTPAERDVGPETASPERSCLSPVLLVQCLHRRAHTTSADPL